MTQNQAGLGTPRCTKPSLILCHFYMYCLYVKLGQNLSFDVQHPVVRGLVRGGQKMLVLQPPDSLTSSADRATF